MPEDVLYGECEQRVQRIHLCLGFTLPAILASTPQLYMYDTYGDGWNGNMWSWSDGSTTSTGTFGPSSTSTATARRLKTHTTLGAFGGVTDIGHADENSSRDWASFRSI